MPTPNQFNRCARVVLRKGETPWPIRRDVVYIVSCQPENSALVYVKAAGFSGLIAVQANRLEAA